jgi:hypothetical protein
MHAYDIDQTMSYAKKLFNTFKNNLIPIHLSGSTKTKKHSLVYKSENREIILNFTKEIIFKKSVPIIIEGEYHTLDELNKELLFLNSHLKI